MLNNIINECCELAQKEYKTRHDWVEKVIHRELCKKLKFDHTNKWYLQNPESVLENETDKRLRDFEIQIDHLILARGPDLVIVKKKKKYWTCRIVDFPVPVDHRVKIEENKKRDKYLDLARELKTTEPEGDGDTNCNPCTWNNPQTISKRTGRLGNQKASGNHPDYSIIKIGQNTEKSPGNSRKLAVTQTQKWETIS